MTSTGQSCTLCTQPLLKFLFNADGDYILNCSSSTCMYGVLHSRVYKADASIVELQPVSVVNECNNDMPDFSSILNDDNVYAQAPLRNDELSLEQDLQAQYSLTANEDRSIDSWLKEFVNAPQETATASPAERTGFHCSTDVSLPLSNQPSQVAKGKCLPSRTPKLPALAAATTTAPAVRRSVRAITVPEKAKTMHETHKPKKAPTKRVVGVSALLKKTQAKAAVLRANMELADETKSDAGSLDSGVQSDLSSSSSTTSASSRTGEMTTIQRLLHLEEAKKRSWGKTGMPGFRPSATPAIPKIKLF